MVTPLIKPRAMKSENSQARPMVVQCPTCQTKFALDSRSIDGIEFPRFHCSRCDHVFSIEEAPPAIRDVNATTAPTSSSPTPESPRSRFVMGEHSDEFEPPSNTQGPLAYEAKSQSPASNYREQTRGLDIPRAMDRGTRVAAPHESGLTNSREYSTSKIPTRETLQKQVSETSHAELTSKDQIEFDFSKTQKKTTEPEITQSESSFDPVPMPEDVIEDFNAAATTEIRSPFVQPRNKAVRQEQTYTAPFSRPTQVRPADISIGGFSRWGSTPMQSLMMVAGPVVIFLAVLGLVSYLLKASPSIANSWVSTLYPSAPQMPPAGLHIVNLNQQNIGLEKGDTISLISGKISNDTNEEFQDIQIEGLVFGSAGQLISSTRLSAGSSLADTKIRSLTPEMIAKLQSEKPRKPLKLQPGARAEFAIAILKPEAMKGKFFSARIYSVRK